MIEFRFDSDRSFAEVVVSGTIEDDATTAWFRGFLAALDGHAHVSGVVDTRGLAGLDVTSDTVRELHRLAEANDHLFGSSRWAIVADRDVVFGMARMYAILRDEAPYEITVFRDMDAARAWLEGAEARS